MKKLFYYLFGIALIFTGCEKEPIIDVLPDSIASEVSDSNLKKGNKVNVCHKGKIISISINAVKAHQAHGDAVDMDGDGYYDIVNDCSIGIDCDDNNLGVNPDSEEVCENGIDDNCDGNDDECQLEIDGLIAYYPFNGNANDESGFNNHGVVNGAILSSDRFGNQNQAYAFDGQNDEIVINSTNILKDFTANSHTISLWITSDSNPNVPKFVIDASAPGELDGDQRGIRFESTNKPIFKWVTSVNSYRAYSPNTILSDGTWHHIVGLFDNSTSVGKIYIDGVEQSISISDGIPSAFELLKIGNISSGGLGNGYFHGKIDDIRIYNRALNDGEIVILSNE